MNRTHPDANPTIIYPWVVERRERVTFGLLAFAHPRDPAPVASVLAAGRLADRLGLDAFYLGDHPARTTDPWTMLSALAVTTERVRLGTVVACVLHRSPVLLARLASDLDHLSGGRLVLGLGSCWDAEELMALGLPMPPIRARQEMLAETVAILEGVWGGAPFDFAGRHYQIRQAAIAPPVQRPRPPLMIAGAGPRVTLRQVAELADACNIGPGAGSVAVNTPDDARRAFDTLRQHCRDVGRPYDAILRTHYTPWLILASTEREAEAKLRRYYPAGLDAAQRQSRICATPEQAVAYYQALADAGAQHFVVQSLDAADRETFQLLAAEVASRVRPRG